MAIVIPGNAVNYPNPLLAVGLKESCVLFGQKPSNGPQCLPVEVDWGTMGGSDKVVGFNIGNSGSTRSFTDLCALQVDNSQCGADIQFVFTDTQTTYTVPAYAPYELFPIFTKANQFYCIAKIDNQIVLSSDISRFTLFNFVPPPASIPPAAFEQDPGALAIIPVAAGSTALALPSPVGTLEGLTVLYTVSNSANAGTATIKLVDGGGQNLAWGAVSTGGNDTQNVFVINTTQSALRYSGGINVVITETADIGGELVINALARRP